MGNVGNMGSNICHAPCMYSGTFEVLLSVAPYLLPTLSEGKVSDGMLHQDSSSPAEDPASHWCGSTQQGSE